MLSERVVDLDVLLVELFVLLYVYLGSQTVQHLLLLLYQRVLVNVHPLNSLLRVHGQATVDKITHLCTYIHS